MGYFEIFCRSYTYEIFRDVWSEWYEGDTVTWRDGEETETREPEYADFAQEALELCQKDCRAFLDQAFDLILNDKPQIKAEMGSFDQAGSDFWRTRIHDGVGFWDGDWPENGDELTKIAQTFKHVDPYIGDDGKIYMM